MAFQSWEESGDEHVMNEINMTPLVDVMLVLLIVFIITAPVMHHALSMNLPEESSQPQELKPETIQISIEADGSYRWNSDLVNEAELTERMAQAAQLKTPPALHLSADRDVRYEVVVHVLNLAQQATLTQIAFVTQPGGAP